MDEPSGADELRRLDCAVSEAADAWLNDPRDFQAYRYLVVAVLARREGIQPSLSAAASAGQDEVFDAVADEHPARPIGEGLRGDVSAVLKQLRGDEPRAE